MIKELPLIKYGEIPSVLLMGNGINKCFGEPSWKAVLEKISVPEYAKNSKMIDEMSYPLQAVVVTDNCVKEGIKLIANDMMPKKMATEKRNLLMKFLDISFDAVLTTNYSYEIECAILPGFDCNMYRSSKYRVSTRSTGKNEKNENEVYADRTEDRLGIYKYMSVENGSRTTNVWHIHGEAARPDSMILGHYEYGTLLSKAYGYISKMIKRYKYCNSRQLDYQPMSWLDYFLIGNVYIVGLGLDLSEMDLWWLINFKEKEKLSDGRIFFYDPNIDEKKNYAKKALAKSYRMNIENRVDFDGEYLGYYEKIAVDIKNKMSI